MSFQVSGLTVRYPETDVPALREVDLSFEPGIHTSVLGPNGAGKSTLLRALLGIVRPESGEVSFDGRPTAGWSRREMARRVALVAATEDFAFPLTVRELVSMGRYPHLGPWRNPAAEDRAVVEAALRELELEGLAGRAISTLSAGELQRARLARAIAQQADHLLLDEPVAHLDLAHELSTFRQIAEMTAGKSLTTITVTHHLNLASRFSDRVVLLAAGRVTASGRPDQVLTEDRLQETFGCRVEVHDLADLGKLVVPLLPVAAR